MLLSETVANPRLIRAIDLTRGAWPQGILALASTAKAIEKETLRRVLLRQG